MALTQLRFQRLLADLTQVELTKRSNASQPRISELERGSRPATEAERHALSAALDASRVALFVDRKGEFWPAFPTETGAMAEHAA